MQVLMKNVPEQLWTPRRPKTICLLLELSVKMARAGRGREAAPNEQIPYTKLEQTVPSAGPASRWDPKQQVFLPRNEFTIRSGRTSTYHCHPPKPYPGNESERKRRKSVHAFRSRFWSTFQLKTFKSWPKAGAKNRTRISPEFGARVARKRAGNEFQN